MTDDLWELLTDVQASPWGSKVERNWARIAPSIPVKSLKIGLTYRIGALQAILCGKRGRLP